MYNGQREDPLLGGMIMGNVANSWDARDLHAALAGRWSELLPELGIAPEFLRNRHGPCPACGGRDRYRFDDRDGRGTFYCSHCGAGDGFKLLQLVHNWDFPTTCRELTQAAGLEAEEPLHQQPPQRRSNFQRHQPAAATPTWRVRALRRSTCSVADVDDVRIYMTSRGVWPVPPGCSLRAHPLAECYDCGKLIGRYPALIADVDDIEGDLVTCHITYVPGGRKLEGTPRKLLSRTTDRVSCCARLMPADGNVLAIAEGIETALAAHLLHPDVPVWAALNASLLAKFVPPPGIHRVVIFADRDVAGREAARRLRDELHGRCRVEIAVPPKPAKDWADVLVARRTL